MLTIEELLELEGNVPTILALKQLDKAYFNQLEHKLGVHSLTLKRSISFLLDRGIVTQLPYDGNVPNVKSWLTLTDFGDGVANCLIECQKTLGSIATRMEGNHRKGKT